MNKVEPVTSKKTEFVANDKIQTFMRKLEFWTIGIHTSRSLTTFRYLKTFYPLRLSLKDLVHLGKDSNIHP